MCTTASYLRMAVSLALTLPLLACSAREESASDGPNPDRQIKLPQVTSTELASALSIGNVMLPGEDRGPLAQALMCVVALDALGERLTTSDVMTSEMLRAFNMAQTFYMQRFEAAADNESISRADRAAARAEVEEVMGDDQQQGRIAIGCLRNLQRPGGSGEAQRDGR